MEAPTVVWICGVLALAYCVSEFALTAVSSAPAAIFVNRHYYCHAAAGSFVCASSVRYCISQNSNYTVDNRCQFAHALLVLVTAPAA
eukprot:16736-Heterococcus_DN1.PRE.1